MLGLNLIHASEKEAKNNNTDFLLDMKNCSLRMHPEYRGRFPRHRGLVIPKRITARA